MMQLWDKLTSLTLYPSCSYGAAHKIQEFEQNQRLIKFLVGLNNDIQT